jgi:hypothetical protein
VIDLYSYLNKEHSELSILYKNGIYAYISINKQEDEITKHNLKITYFVPKMDLFVKDKKNAKMILIFIKHNIDKNNFVLQPFFDEAYNNAVNELSLSTTIEENEFSINSTNQDYSSEMILNIFEVLENQYIISIYYDLELP